MMLTDPKLWIDLFGVLTEMVFLAYFMRTLFGRMRSWYGGAAVYLILTGFLWAISYGITLAHLRTIIYLIVLPLAVIICYRGQILAKLFAGLSYIFIISTTENAVHNFLMLFFGQVYATGSNNMQDYILGVAISRSLMLIVIQILTEWLKRSHNQKGQLSLGNFCLLLTFPLTTVCAFFVLYYAFVDSNDIKGVLLLAVITSLFLLADINIFILFNRLLEAARLEQEHILAKQQLQNQQHYYSTLIEKTQSMRKWSHEVKNAFIVISAYIKQGQYQDALDYIANKGNRFSETIENMTDNVALDAVLTQKKQLAQEMGIEMRYRIALNDTIKIEIMDLVVVLANGLDNALEAVAKLSDPAGKMITCELLLQKEWFKIVITNPVNHPIKADIDQLKTDKKDTMLHGIGLSNVKDIVEAHHGQLVLDCQGNTFIFTALMANE